MPGRHHEMYDARPSAATTTMDPLGCRRCMTVEMRCRRGQQIGPARQRAAAERHDLPRHGLDGKRSTSRSTADRTDGLANPGRTGSLPSARPGAAPGGQRGVRAGTAAGGHRPPCRLLRVRPPQLGQLHEELRRRLGVHRTRPPELSRQALSPSPGGPGQGGRQRSGRDASPPSEIVRDRRDRLLQHACLRQADDPEMVRLRQLSVPCVPEHLERSRSDDSSRRRSASLVDPCNRAHAAVRSSPGDRGASGHTWLRLRGLRVDDARGRSEHRRRVATGSGVLTVGAHARWTAA